MHSICLHKYRHQCMQSYLSILIKSVDSPQEFAILACPKECEYPKDSESDKYASDSFWSFGLASLGASVYVYECVYCFVAECYLANGGPRARWVYVTHEYVHCSHMWSIRRNGLPCTQPAFILHAKAVYTHRHTDTQTHRHTDTHARATHTCVMAIYTNTKQTITQGNTDTHTQTHTQTHTCSVMTHTHAPLTCT
jgi:hypothetical protein